MKQWFEHWWVRPVKPAMWLFWVCANLAVLGYVVEDSRMQQQRHDVQIHEMSHTLRSHLDALMIYAVDAMQRLREPLEQTEGAERDIYRILLEEVDRAPAVIRFAWSGRDARLSVTSVHGIYLNPPDISSRDYIHHAKQAPYDIYVTPILNHVMTKREFIGVSMGLSDSEGEYLGNVLATISIAPLREMIAQRMASCACSYMVFAPHGEVIAQQAISKDLLDLVGRQSDVGAFRVVAMSDVSSAHARINRTILLGAMVLLILNGAVAFAYRLIQLLWIKPVASALQRIEPQVMAAHERLPLPEVMQRIGVAFAAIHDRLNLREAQLDHTRQMLEALREKQMQFLGASSQELSQTYHAISDYAGYLEERMEHQNTDPDAPYVFDDVREIGMNLQFLSSAFARICEIRAGAYRLHHTMLSPCLLLDGVIEELSDAMQRRNIDLKLDTNDAQLTCCDAHMLSLMLWAVLYLAVRHAEDESTIAVQLASNAQGITLAVCLSHYRAAMLPSYQRDFSRFIRSLSFNEGAAMLAMLRGHVNAMMLDSFLALCVGRWSVEANGQFGVMLSLQVHSFTLADLVD